MATMRERLRVEMTAEIKAAGRARLAVDGANLSLRAVARDVGMVSSAVYRYFPSRDALLTALIIDTYDEVGELVELADAEVPRDQLAQRFRSFARTTRRWAVGSPNEYALIFGSPVPGYDAPPETLPAAMRVTTVLAHIITDGLAAGALADPGDPVDPALAADLAAIAAAPPFQGVPPALLARGMAAWSAVYGLISFEIFGAYGPIVTAPEPLFEHQLDGIVARLGLD